MKMYTWIIFLTLFVSSLFAQKYSITGRVVNSNSNVPLSYANVVVRGANQGTSANVQGEFLLKLNAENVTLIASYIGFISDTIDVDLSVTDSVKFLLTPSSVKLEEVTVFPGVNPALEVIERAIKYKNNRKQKLNSYQYQSYTKATVLTTKDFSSKRNNSQGFDLGKKDTSKLKITGIIENESIGYFKKPNQKKEIIKARKQSSNFPSTINILTGGRIIQDFYTDDIQFFGRPLPSPISDNALNYYYYYIEDTLSLDDKNIFQIYFAPDDESDPGFYGRIFIIDKSFALAKLDIELNDAANPGGIFTEVKIFQQFHNFKEMYMPIDYRIFVKGNFLGLAKFGFELNTILHDYEINKQLSDNIFNMAVVTVDPEADKKDSTYWKSRQTIPNTIEEVVAYKRIDSLEAIPVSFGDRFSILANRIRFDENISLSGPLYAYHFNRVEGHAVGLDARFKNYLDKRFSSKFEVGYGFSDHLWKGGAELNYLFGKYRTGKISFSINDKLVDLFGESNNYNVLTSTLWNLLSKYDFRDYYYSNGFSIGIEKEVFPVLKLGISFTNSTDKNASINTNFSIFKRDSKFPDLKPIYETKNSALEFLFKLDFRKYIEDGYFRRRINSGNYLPVVSGTYILSNGQLGSNENYKFFKSSLYWKIPTFNSASFSLDVNSVYSNGAIPVQNLYALPGNIKSGGKDFSFRTLRIGEIFGDRVLSFNIENNFNDELFRALKIPWVKNNQFIFTLFFNAAWVDISDKSFQILPNKNIKLFNTPFMEVGFGIGQILFPLKIEFAWKLTHRGTNNFVIGINTFAL